MKRRIAAEWEPALGVMIAWPLHLPHEIVSAFTEEDRVFLLCASEADERDAIAYLSPLVARPEALSCVRVPQGYDGSWPRDWGPQPVFDEWGNFRLGCPQYRYSTPNTTPERMGTLYNPYDETFQESMEERGIGSEGAIGEPLTRETLTPYDDQAAPAIAYGLGVESFKMPIAFTGGNIMSDGRGTLVSCAALVNENAFLGNSEESFRVYAASELGADTYYVLSNYEDMGIQHVDCLLKMVDEETLIVARPPEDHPLHDRYERIVNEEISRMRTCYGRPYRIFRVDTARYNGDELTAYANSYILNKRVYVPMYGVDQDEVALEQWREAMPGYEVRGFTYSYSERPEEECLGVYETDTGWAPFDVIHCRTRSVWDPEMLYVSVERAGSDTVREGQAIVYAQVVDYSCQGLTSAPRLFWRLEGEDGWHGQDVSATPSPEQWEAALPQAGPGQAIQYYVCAESRSGRIEYAPRTAPQGFYTYTA